MKLEGLESSLKNRLARNLQYLVKEAGESQRAFADKAKMDSKAFNNLVAGRFDCRLTQLQRAAAAFGLQPWQLLAVEFESSPAEWRQIVRLLDQFSKARPEGRAAILQVAAAVNSQA